MVYTKDMAIKAPLRGRPPDRVGNTRDKTILVRLSKKDMDSFDAVRGTMTKSTWLYELGLQAVKDITKANTKKKNKGMRHSRGRSGA